MTFEEFRNIIKKSQEQKNAHPTPEQRITAAENAIADLAIAAMTGGDTNV